jgi:hypothetical protein
MRGAFFFGLVLALAFARMGTFYHVYPFKLLVVRGDNLPKGIDLYIKALQCCIYLRFHCTSYFSSHCNTTNWYAGGQRKNNKLCPFGSIHFCPGLQGHGSLCGALHFLL